MRAEWILALTFLFTPYSHALAVEAAPVRLPVRNVQLVNQEGQPFQLYDYKGKYVFISFVYSRCPLAKMCPLTMTLTRRLVKAWEAKRGKGTLQALAITLDPDYDTATVLKAFGKQHSVDFRNFTLATGAPQALSDFDAEFNVVGFPSRTSIAHNVRSALLDPNLGLVRQYDDNAWTPETVLQDAAKDGPGKPPPAEAPRTAQKTRRP